MTNSSVVELNAVIKRTKNIKLVTKIITFIVLVFWAFLAILPIVWVAVNSFRNSIMVTTKPLFYPFGELTFNNYQEIFGGSINIGLAYFNSLYTSSIIVLCTLIVAFLAAFALARFKFFGRRALNMLIVACMMFPAFSLMLPLYRMFDKLFLINTHTAIILPQIALNMSFAIILLTGFLKSLPLEVEESAYLDGANIFTTIFRIVIPMMRSALITCVIFIFLWSYNELFLQTFLLRTADKRLIPYLMVTVTTLQGTDYGKMTAASTLVSVPMLIIYLFLQNHIIKGLTAGAVKG